MNRFNFSVFAAFLTTILFSLSAICGHRSAKLIGGTEANFWRAALATALLAAWSYVFGRGLEGSAFTFFLLSGIFGIGFGDVAYFQSLPRLGPRLTVLLVQCLTAPLGALIEWLWLGTTLSLGQIAFGLVALAGVGMALAPDRHLKLSRREVLAGGAFGVLAAIGGALGAVFSRKAYAVVQASGESIHPINAGYQRMLGGVLIAGLFLLAVKRRQVRLPAAEFNDLLETSRNKWRRVWFWIVLNALAGQTLGVSCMQWAFETTPTGIVLPIIALSPIVVIPLTYVIDGERPSRRSLMGSLVAVAGVVALALSR